MRVAAVCAWAALCAEAVPRALQQCSGDPDACAWAAVCMGMPARQCARPAPTCARWFNGCRACDVVGGLPSRDCEMCVFPSAPTQCLLDRRAVAVATPAPPGVRLRVERSTPRKPSEPCTQRVGLDLPAPYALIAVYGDEQYPLTLPPAVRQVGAVRSEVAPLRAEGAAVMTAIGIGALDAWGPDRGATVTDGAWFAPPPDRDAPYDPACERSHIATFAVPRVAVPGAGGTFVFSAQLFDTVTHASVRLHDLAVHVDAVCAVPHPAV